MNVRQFERAYRANEPDATSADIHMYFKEGDQDGNGKLSFPELA